MKVTTIAPTISQKEIGMDRGITTRIEVEVEKVIKILTEKRKRSEEEIVNMMMNMSIESAKSRDVKMIENITNLLSIG